MTTQTADSLSRSDIVRKRRELRKPARRQTKSGRKQQANQPRIISRGQFSTATLNMPAAKTAKRRLSIPIGANTEIKLPAIPRLKVGNRLLSGILFLFLAAATWLLLASPELQVTDVQVAGMHLVNTDTISDLLDIKGKTIFEADPAVMAEKLQEEFPQLYVNARVKVGFPAEIVLELEEREPVIFWSTPGQELWVDAEGVVLTPLQDVEGLAVVQSLEAPPVSQMEKGEDEFALMNREVVSAVLQLQETLPEGTALTYDKNRGLGWSAAEGWQVYLGVLPDQMKVRMAVYDAIVEYLIEKDYQPEMVSVEHLHAPFFR